MLSFLKWKYKSFWKNKVAALFFLFLLDDVDFLVADSKG
jgi:hypothetical protein